jgi:hypothetical protein
MTKIACSLAMVAGYMVTIAIRAQAPLTPGFDIENASHTNIVRAFAKPQSAAKWGSPLADSSVPAGATGSIKVPSETNCVYDVRMVFADGHAEDRAKVDVCKHSRIRVGAGADGHE